MAKRVRYSLSAIRAMPWPDGIDLTGRKTNAFESFAGRLSSAARAYAVTLAVGWVIGRFPPAALWF